MISLDLAINNVSDRAVLLHVLSRPLLELNARDEKGAAVSINDYTTALEATSLKTYRQIEPSHVMLASFELLAGCTNEVHAFLETDEGTRK